MRQGACRLNDLWLVHSGPGFMHFRCDMRAKYARIVAYSDTSVFIGANGRTLNKAPKREWETPHGMTEVHVYVPGGHRWTVEATLSRYTLDLFCFTARTGHFVWSAEHGHATSRRKAR